MSEPTVIGIPKNPTCEYMLKTYQRQLDPEGIEVGVSRQALDEALERSEDKDARIKELSDALLESLMCIPDNSCWEKYKDKYRAILTKVNTERE